MKIWQRLKTSSKWQGGVVALVWVLGQDLWIKWGVTEQMFSSVWWTLLGVIGAQGIADLGRGSTPVEPPAPPT